MAWMNEDTFNQLAQKNFAFLVKKYDMHVTDKKTAECVKFKSKIAWVEIWYDKYSLSVVMGRNDGHYHVSLWDIMQFLYGEGNSAIYMASDEGQLERGLIKLSAYAEKYCNRAFTGDIEFYKEIYERKEMRKQEATYWNKANAIEEQAKDAWEKQDYMKIISLYEPMAEHLSPLQKKRLSICMKKISQ
mgnify:CR=1 FL=1